MIFNTQISSEKEVSTRELNKSQIGDTESYIKFSLEENRNKKNSSILTGSFVSFSIIEDGRWNWEESKAKICMICKLPLKENQTIAQCPMCQSLFHREHVFEWLKVKGKCPVCMQNLRPEGLQPTKI